MAILNVDLQDIRGLKKYDAQQAFNAWNEKQCPNPKAFSFEGEKITISGKEHVWKVASFGDYCDASGHYRRFISYRCGKGNLSRVYSWVWDEASNRWNECAMQGFGNW